MSWLTTALTAALLATEGCADSTLTAKDAIDSGASDAGRRVNVRKVPVEVPAIATRTVSKGADGEPVYGKIVPLDGADVCIVQRRDAFHPFEAFEKLDPPTCAKSVATEPVHIEGAPANSDLVMTVEYEGMRPLALSNQTDDYGSGIWADVFSLIVLEEGATDAWLEPDSPRPAGEGSLGVGAVIAWSGPGVARPDLIPQRDVFFGPFPAWDFAASIHAVIEPAAGGDPIQTAGLSRLRYVSLPAGSARVSFASDNPHVTGCGPVAALAGLQFGVDPGVLEMPVLAGHDQVVGVLCGCGGDSDDAELTDLATCSFAQDAVSDADAGAR